VAKPVSETYSAVDHEFDRSMDVLRANPSPTTVLFSGGVDSSLVADALRGQPELELLTVGTASSTDLASGRSAARLLGLPWRGAMVGRDEVEAAMESCGDLWEGTHGPSRAVAVSFAVAVGQTRPSRVLTAQGVDELFLGYAHFRGLTGAALEARYHADLALLVEHEWPRALGIAQRLRRTLMAPFLERRLMDACQSVPLEDRAPGAEVKPWLRAWAEERGLPAELAHRPKKALQYGSGIERLLRARSRRGPRPSITGDPASAR
jgi:asparagine synthase (glutamine-hydrolysing)